MRKRRRTKHKAITVVGANHRRTMVYVYGANGESRRRRDDIIVRRLSGEAKPAKAPKSNGIATGRQKANDNDLPSAFLDAIEPI